MPEYPPFDVSKLNRLLTSRRRIAQAIRVEEQCASTSDIIKDLATQSGADSADGLLILAENQTEGRGRQSRDWWTGPPRANLAFSIGVASPLPHPVEALGLMASCALTEVIERTVAAPVAMKWPNDVLIGKAKTAGLLCEVPAGLDSFAVLGIGVNFHEAPPQEGMAYETTCISRHAPKAKLSRTLFLAAFLVALEKRLAVFQLAGSRNLEKEMLERLRTWAPNGVRDPRTGASGMLNDFTFKDGLLLKNKSNNALLPHAWLASLERL